MKVNTKSQKEHEERNPVIAGVLFSCKVTTDQWWYKIKRVWHGPFGTLKAAIHDLFTSH